MINGLSMSLRHIHIPSDICLQYFELYRFHNLNFPFYTRYVDDCFALLNSRELNLLNINILSVIKSFDDRVYI